MWRKANIKAFFQAKCYVIKRGEDLLGKSLLQLLSRDEIATIHETSLRVLRNIGVKTLKEYVPKSLPTDVEKELDAFMSEVFKKTK